MHRSLLSAHQTTNPQYRRNLVQHGFISPKELKRESEQFRAAMRMRKQSELEGKLRDLLEAADWDIEETLALLDGPVEKHLKGGGAIDEILVLQVESGVAVALREALDIVVEAINEAEDAIDANCEVPRLLYLLKEARERCVRLVAAIADAVARPTPAHPTPPRPTPPLPASSPLANTTPPQVPSGPHRGRGARGGRGAAVAVRAQGSAEHDHPSALRTQ